MWRQGDRELSKCPWTLAVPPQPTELKQKHLGSHHRERVQRARESKPRREGAGRQRGKAKDQGRQSHVLGYTVDSEWAESLAFLLSPLGVDLDGLARPFSLDSCDPTMRQHEGKNIGSQKECGVECV